MLRTRRLAGVTLALLALSALLVGCGHRDPSSYGDTVEHNFVQGCQVVFAGGVDNANDSAVSAAIKKDPQADAHRKTCQCVYDNVSHKSTGIPFKDFKALQDQVRDRKSLASIVSGPNSDANLKKYAGQLRDTYNRCASATPTTAIPNGGGVVS
jgi:hypothetical protein